MTLGYNIWRCRLGAAEAGQLGDMDVKEKVCPVCGGNEFGKGVLGSARLIPIEKCFSSGSEVVAEICKNCGTVVSFKVMHPEQFTKCI
jgi:RNA polymerase subunit RPABC4/transcription elongation factor Spt4